MPHRTANLSRHLAFSLFCGLLWLGRADHGAYAQKRIKDIIIYQPGGWSGLAKNGKGAFEWPAYGGMNAYLTRSPEILSYQMSLIKALGSEVAIAVLLMTDSDSERSGYHTCWKGSWTGELTCDSGKMLYPLAMYDHIRAAARVAGIRYAPEFSLMNYDGVRGAAVLPKLRAAIDWWRVRLPDPGAAKSPDGRYYVILDSLPQQTNLTGQDKQELIGYMHAQQDIEWIDFLVNANTPPGNAYYHDNIYHAAWGDEATLDWLNAQQGDHLLWCYYPNKPSLSYEEAHSQSKEIPSGTANKWMNISPSSPSKYPVLIYQWNEYGEFLMFEPSTRTGNASYERLKEMILRQP